MQCLGKISRLGYEQRKQTESRCRKSPIPSSSSSSRLPFDDDVILDILAKGKEWTWSYRSLRISQELGCRRRLCSYSNPNIFHDIFLKLFNKKPLIQGLGSRVRTRRAPMTMIGDWGGWEEAGLKNIGEREHHFKTACRPRQNNDQRERQTAL